MKAVSTGGSDDSTAAKQLNTAAAGGHSASDTNTDCSYLSSVRVFGAAKPPSQRQMSVTLAQ